MSTEVDFYPLSSKLSNSFKFYASYTHWSAFDKTGYDTKTPSDSGILKAGLAYYFDPGAKHYSVGFDYSNGQNIETGLPKQKTLTLSFKIGFKAGH